MDSFLETKLTQSRTRITNCFLSSIFRNAIPGNDSFLLLSLFLSAGDKRKREEKRKKERKRNRSWPLYRWGWIRNSAMPWPLTKELREFKRFAVVYGCIVSICRAHRRRHCVAGSFRNSLAQRVHRENAAISMRTFLRCCARMGSTPAR